MARYELVLSGGSGGDRFQVAPGGIVLGRSPDADVVLTGQSVSRRHARVWLEGDALLVEDLGSRNGITVNGKQVERAALQAGDQLGVGESLFDVLKYMAVAEGRSVISYDKGSTLCDLFVHEDTDRFPILYRATQLLGTVFDLDQLLSDILELIFDALPVRRGFVLTLSKDSQEAEVRATRAREGESGGPPLSRTLIDHVVYQRDAILTRDAQDDSRFDVSQSIVGHAIRAAMCAPLCGRQVVVGAVYVDSGDTDTVFGKEDLELLTVLGRVVGVAVENAQLYQDNVEQERLAALGEAMAGVGHCVKNVLTSLRGGTAFIDQALEKADVSHIEKGWPLLRRALERIDLLVMNMLSFARDQAPERASMDVNALIEEVLDVVRPRAERAGVSLDFVPCEDGAAWADERQIYRVLLNLLTNALDACVQRGGAVMITSACDEAGCTIEVHDNGVGVPPEILPRLSQAFVSSKGSNGIGLGLACSYRIVRAHGGNISVKTVLDKGSRFTVFLPSDTGLGKAVLDEGDGMPFGL